MTDRRPDPALPVLPLSSRHYVAILDIGSNAVRLVIYDGFTRAPVRIHMERRICNLGSDLASTGKLNAEGVAKALDALRRYSGLIEAMKVRHVHAVATAALRDASDGPAFIARVQKEFGLAIRVIDGDAEAHLSALGVLMNGLAAGDGNAPCLIGDYGGGSLELILLEGGQVKDKASLPLGSHRLHAIKGREARLASIDEHLGKVGFIKNLSGVDFYALGGAWRSMAKAHMHMVGHPLKVLDHYAIEGRKALEFSGLMSRQSMASLERTVGMSKKRLQDMGVAALTMERIFEKISPRQLVFSATGLREGLLYEQLKGSARKEDPLIASCRKVAAKISRFDDIYHFNVLARWMMPLFADQEKPFIRLLEASCLLSDLSWFEHEDYQAQHAFERVLVLPLYGVDHPGRVFLALSQYIRYRGFLPTYDTSVTTLAKQILPPIDIEIATVVGLAQRIGYLLTGGALALLKQAEIGVTPETITLTLRGRAKMLDAESIAEAMADLASAMGRRAEIAVLE